jgi:hypothetical protein
MNERIKELANRAMVEREDGWSEFDANVFAELIVRECTNMLPADTIRNEDGVHMFYVIRDHFGVPTIGR